MSASQSLPRWTSEGCASPSRNVSSRRSASTSCSPAATLSASSSSHDPSGSVPWTSTHIISNRPNTHRHPQSVAPAGIQWSTRTTPALARFLLPHQQRCFQSPATLPSNPALAERRAAKSRSRCANGEGRLGRTAGSSEVQASGSCASLKRGRRMSPHRRRARSGTRLRSGASTSVRPASPSRYPAIQQGG